MMKKKNIYQFYLKRYGLGDSLVKFLCDYSGFHPQFKGLKGNYITDKIRNFLLSYPQYLDIRLKHKIHRDIMNIIKSRSYKALRMTRRLPVRGQRTRTNHQNAKRTLLMFK